MGSFIYDFDWLSKIATVMPIIRVRRAKPCGRGTSQRLTPHVVLESSDVVFKKLRTLAAIREAVQFTPMEAARPDSPIAGSGRRTESEKPTLSKSSEVSEAACARDAMLPVPAHVIMMLYVAMKMVDS